MANARKCHTTMNLVRCEQTWTIEHFSHCDYRTMPQPSIPNASPNYFLSKKFFPTSDRTHQFYLVLYPRDYNEESKGYVSLFLYWVPLSDDIAEKTVGYKFSIIDESGNKTRIVGSRTTFQKIDNKGIGYPRYISREPLFPPANRYLPDDKLTIHCEVSYVTDIVTQVNTSHDCDPLQCSQLIASNFADFWDSPDAKAFSDVVLEVGKHSNSIHAHKVVLAARSPVFRAMFSTEMREKEQSKVKIIDIRYEVMQELLRYIYTGKAQQVSQLAPELFAAADKYNLDCLKSICEKQLCNQITPDNANELLQLADMHSSPLLKKKTVEFIHKLTVDSIATIIDEAAKLIQTSDAIKNLSKTISGSSNCKREAAKDASGSKTKRAKSTKKEI